MTYKNYEETRNSDSTSHGQQHRRRDLRCRAISDTPPARGGGHRTTTAAYYYPTTTLQTPVHVCEPVLPGEYHQANQRGGTTDHLEHLEKLREAQELARIHLSHTSTRQSEYFNRRHRDWECQIGDRVMRREHPLSAAGRGYAAKLAPKYSGPWTVENRVSRLVYNLRKERGRRLHHIHVKDLKPAH